MTIQTDFCRAKITKVHHDRRGRVPGRAAIGAASLSVPTHWEDGSPRLFTKMELEVTC